MINIVIPMAGLGSRFSKAGYVDPKPLIPVLGRPMIELVIENLKPACPHQFIFLCQSEHIKSYPLRALLESKAPGCDIVEVNGLTEGAACTVLLARQFINNDSPLMIANCDQYINLDIMTYLSRLDQADADGLIMTMTACDNKWSYVRLNDNNEITEVVEKEVVSEEATVGIYNYRRGVDFVCAAEKMIAKNIRTNKEFYVAPVYNEMLAQGMKVIHHNIGALGQAMHGLGTPEDLDSYLSAFGKN